jgi:hypothetical protein
LSPAHATPTTLTDSANSLWTSSTEGASALQVPQPGAQNHKTTGFSARAFDNTNDPPPTTGEVKSSTPMDSWPDEPGLLDWDESRMEEMDEVASVPQAPSNTAAAKTPTNAERLTWSS